jgi:hypothetical protein
LFISLWILAIKLAMTKIGDSKSSDTSGGALNCVPIVWSAPKMPNAETHGWTCREASNLGLVT